MSQCYDMTDDGARCTNPISEHLFCIDHQDTCKIYTPLLITFLNSIPEFTSLYVLQKPLNSISGFGQLFHVTHRATSKPAILKVKMQSKVLYPCDDLNNEVELLYHHFTPRHNRIVRMIDSFNVVFPNKEQDLMFLVGYTMEPMLCDLQEWWFDQQKGSPALFKTVCKQAIEMIEQYHSSGYLHCDVKPKNICIRREKPLDLVLIDFGMTWKDATVKNNGYGGTEYFSSLQCALKKQISYRDDMETIGYVLLYLLHPTLLPNTPEKRIEAKRSLNTFPTMFQNYFIECRQLAIHEKPNYKKLLRILGVRSTLIFEPYITPSTKYVNYFKLKDLDQFDGIRGDPKNIEILHDHELYTTRDLGIWKHKHDLFSDTKLIKFITKLGIPQKDAEAFVHFCNIRK